jgi:hypothetical protein
MNLYNKSIDLVLYYIILFIISFTCTSGWSGLEKLWEVLLSIPKAFSNNAHLWSKAVLLREFEIMYWICTNTYCGNHCQQQAERQYLASLVLALPEFTLLLISSWKQFWQKIIIVIPKNLNFDKFPKDLLASSIHDIVLNFGDKLWTHTCLVFSVAISILTSFLEYDTLCLHHFTLFKFLSN